MVDVFVSRPIELPSEFEDGLCGLLGLLADRGLNARTLGVSDFSVENPLDAVIKLMNQCSGAAILGYPPLTAADGGDPDSKIKLPSAWNQIEAALAHVKRLPMMIVTHPGVDQGIFDRGTAGRFVFTEDLSNAGWPLQTQIRGAVKSWIALMASNPRTESNAGDYSAVMSDSPGRVATPLTEEHLDVLSFIAIGENVVVDDIAVEFGIGDQKAQYFVDGLVSLEAVDRLTALFVDDDDDEVEVLALSAVGRKILFDKGLLE